MRIDYTLTPQARVSAGRGGQVQNVRTVHQVLPGSVIRGALGAAWCGPTDARFVGGAAQADFDELFAGLMDVHAAIPGLDKAGGRDEALFQPFSWVKCKYRSESGCGSDDQAWYDQAVAVVKGSSDWRRTCPTCGQPVEQSKGAWRLGTNWDVATVRTALTKGVAEDDMLFTRRAMIKEVTYRGSLRLASNPRPEVLEWLLKDKMIRVGGQRSTMGACRWQAVVATDKAEQITGSCVVQLKSPAILIDDFGAPSLDLAGALAGILDPHGAGTVTRVWTRPEVVTGWHGIAGLPKPSEWAIAAGSVALVEGASAALVNLLDAGIGVRRAEGYGQLHMQPVSVTDPIRVGGEGGQETHSAPVEAASPEPSPPSPFDELKRFLPDAARDQTFRAMFAEAQRIKQLRDGGFPEHIVAQRIDGLVRWPWMRDLSGETQHAVTELLSSDPLNELMAMLTTEIGEGRPS